MAISNLIKSTLLVMFAVSSGQMSGAAGSEGRKIDTFSTDSQEVPAAIGSLQISYLPNSKLDRLRVHLPVVGAPVCSPEAPALEPGSFEYVMQTGRIAAVPIKVVSIAQILNANPFSAAYEVSSPERAKYKYLIVEKWLIKCVKEAGLDELAVEQASDLCIVNEQNEKNLRDAGNALAALVGYTERPTPSEGVEYLLAEMFGEIRRPTSTELKADHIANRPCSLQ